VKQYYYRTNNCKALQATDAECICWHDEGTGPFPNHRIGVHTCWRVKPQANKAVSDTPKTDAAYVASTGVGIYELFKESQDIERELNAANERIKRLEEAGDRLMENHHNLYRIMEWLKAKEAKP